MCGRGTEGGAEARAALQRTHKNPDKMRGRWPMPSQQNIEIQSQRWALRVVRDRETSGSWNSVTPNLTLQPCLTHSQGSCQCGQQRPAEPSAHGAVPLPTLPPPSTQRLQLCVALAAGPGLPTQLPASCPSSLLRLNPGTPARTPRTAPSSVAFVSCNQRIPTLTLARESVLGKE